MTDTKSETAAATQVDSPKESTPANNQKQEPYDSEWLKGTSAEIEAAKNAKQKKANSGGGGDFSHPVYKKLSKINGRINDMSTNDLIRSLEELKLNTK